jgi:hypothetical protein
MKIKTYDPTKGGFNVSEFREIPVTVDRKMNMKVVNNIKLFDISLVNSLYNKEAYKARKEGEIRIYKNGICCGLEGCIYQKEYGECSKSRTILKNRDKYLELHSMLIDKCKLFMEMTSKW